MRQRLTDSRLTCPLTIALDDTLLARFENENETRDVLKVAPCELLNGWPSQRSDDEQEKSQQCWGDARVKGERLRAFKSKA